MDNIISIIKSDTIRQYGRFGWGLLIIGILIKRTFRVIIMMRLCQAASKSSGVFRFSLPFFMVLHRLVSGWAALDMPWQAKVGPGLALVHGWGLVIDPNVKIGKNVTLFHGVTLGRRDRISSNGERLTEYPVLEDEVWVGPNAIIVGGVTIGRGSRIAGGAFVTENVPPHSVVSGNPAVIVKSNCVADVMNPAPI